MIIMIIIIIIIIIITIITPTIMKKTTLIGILSTSI